MLNFVAWKALFCAEPLKDFILYMLGGGLSNASSPECSSAMGMHMAAGANASLSLSTHLLMA